MSTQGFWMNETSGVLEPAVKAYLCGEAMTAENIAAIRAYFRIWIASPNWRGATIKELRKKVDGLVSRAAIDDWLQIAVEAGIDPL